MQAQCLLPPLYLPHNPVHLSASLRLPPPHPPQERLRLPWPPLFSEEEVQRGTAYYGSGARLRRVAAKLLNGQPITVVTLGGSVTSGSGVPTPQQNYASRFFQFINSSFPHRCWEAALRLRGRWGGCDGQRATEAALAADAADAPLSAPAPACLPAATTHLTTRASLPPRACLLRPAWSAWSRR